LASSEMTRAQYDRSLAAQQQSKAGDQWSFFQAKRLRGAMQRSTLDLLKSTISLRPLAPDDIGDVSPEARMALSEGVTPDLPPAPAFDEHLKVALEALEAGKSESEILAPLAKVSPDTLAHTLRAARDRSQAFDHTLKPLNEAVDALEKHQANASAEISRSLTAARLRFTAARYDAEARLNQAIANLYELQVRQSNASAERHHRRSGRFFYGMLAAQAAVIIATFSLAAQKRNYLWALAAAAGAAAVSFAVYVYLCV